jgi:hypothetical protein
MNFNNKLRCIPIVCCVKVWLKFQNTGFELVSAGASLKNSVPMLYEHPETPIIVF